MDYILSILGPLGEGSLVSLELFCITLLLSIPLGVALALMRLSRHRWLGVTVSGYLWLMRGTPLMLQLLFIYYALPLLPGGGIQLPDFPAAVVAFVLNYAAYFAEIFRSGIQAVPRGQFEAARVLGMSAPLTMRRIVLPQVLRITLPPVSNETINLVKDTSLVYILAMNDLLRVARTIVQREFDMTPFLIAGIFYLAMTAVLTYGFKKLEAHYGRYGN